jgi:hypothetical protein
MRETRPSGSVEGVTSNRDPYSDSELDVTHVKHSGPSDSNPSRVLWLPTTAQGLIDLDQSNQFVPLSLC